MDAESSEAIAQLADRIDALEVSLRAEFRTELGQVRNDLDAKFAEAMHHTDVQFAALKREMHVLNESVRDDIRMLAEGFAVITVKLDSLRR